MLPDSLINICNRLEIVKSVTWFFNTHWIETLLVILVVTLFNFGYFAEAGIWVNYYHHNFMIATINDLFQGKHLLVDTFNQYGLLYPYFLYLLFKIFIPLSYLNLYFLFMILTMLYFLIYFFFLKQLIQRTTLSLVGLYVAIGLYTLFHLHIFPTSENYVWPGGIPLRHFFDVTVFFLLLKNKNFHSRTLSWMGAVFCALALFYNLETGISLVIAYSCFHLFVIFANSTNNSIDKIVFFLARIIQLMMCILALLASISIYTYYQSGHFPDWKLFSFFALLYQAGFTSMPTPKIGVYLLYLFVYFAVVTVILYRVVISKPVSWKWFVMSSLSVYGLFTINYYMGRSTPTNLPLNSVSFVTLILYMFVEVQSWLREVRNRSYFILLKNARSILFLILFFLVIKTSFNLIERINYRVAIFLEVQNLKKYPFNRGFIVLPYTETPGFTGDDLLASVAEIKKLTKGTKKILLFSRFDVVILTMAEKTLLVPYPMLEQIYFVSDLKRIGNELVKLKNKPSYLFIEKRTENPFEESTAGKVTSYDSARYLFSALSPYYEFKKQVGILDVYQLKE